MTDVQLPWIRAVVDDGLTETWYLRAGTGAPVLVLAAERELRERLVGSLAGHARITAPEPPTSSGIESSTWLRGFLDGIGVTPRVILADEFFLLGARELAAQHMDGDRPQVVVVDGGAIPSPLNDAAAETLRLLSPR